MEVLFFIMWLVWVLGLVLIPTFIYNLDCLLLKEIKDFTVARVLTTPRHNALCKHLSKDYSPLV